MPEIYAEKIIIGDIDGYHDVRWVVYNGDIIGTYTIMVSNHGEVYGASRDYHRLVTPRIREGVNAYQAWLAGDMEDDMPRHDGSEINESCDLHGGKACICDGSSLVEKTTDDKRAFAIAAMMAEID